MKKFTIISDSSCDLKSTDINEQLIEFITVPILYNLGGTEYADHEDNDVASLTVKMKENKSAPKTSCPSVETFAEAMRSAVTNQVFVLTVSSKLSGTYNSARLAAETVTAEQPAKKIFIFDALTTSAGLARIIYKLTDLMKRGADDFDSLCKKLPEIRSHNRIRFLLNDLGNLVKSGRMSKVLGIITSVIPIKLICGDNGEGEIKKYKQVLGMKKGIEYLAEFPAEKLTAGTGKAIHTKTIATEDKTAAEKTVSAEKFNNSDSADTNKESLIVISHCNNLESAGLLKTILESKFGFKNIKTLLMRGIATFFANDKGIAIAY